MHEPTRVAGAVIVGDDVPVEQWQRLLRSLALAVDQLFVLYTGKHNLFPYNSPTPSPPVLVQHFAWCDDFSAARNANFAMVYAPHHRERYDWVLWVDSDDELIDGDKLPELISSLKPTTQAVHLPYEYAWDEQSGEVRILQWRERLLRLDCAWRWHYRIHEVCHSPAGVKHTRRDQLKVRHWRQAFYSDEATRDRNRRLLTRAVKEEPHELRYIFYLANELWIEGHVREEAGDPTAAGCFNAAERFYTKYVVAHNASDEGYQAQHRRADCRRALGDHSKAISYDLQALRIRPKWAEAYVGIAQSFMALEEWGLCRDWADNCILNASSQPERESFISAEPLTQHYTPFLLRGLARLHTGDAEGARQDFEVCQAIMPNDQMQANIAICEKLIDQSVPSQLRQQRFGTQREQSVALVTRPHWENWDGDKVRAGISGSETAVFELARRFAEDGWRAAIFATPEELHEDEYGIEWYNASDWSATEPWHTVIASRCPEVFDADLDARQRLLWMHDVNTGNMAQGPWGDRFARPDLIISPSAWHRRHLAQLYDIEQARIEVVPNGAHTQLFFDAAEEGAERRMDRFLWGSSPERGLMNVLQMWPFIRSRYPDAELNVFYGFAGIDSYLRRNNNPIMAMMRSDIQSVVEQLGGEDGGIVWWDRQPRDVVAEVAATSGVWLYPTNFCDTFCITAIEYQAAGVLPLTSDIAALRETVAVPELRISGHAGNHDYHNRFLTKLDQLICADTDQLEAYRSDGRTLARNYDWDSVYANYWRPLVGIQPKVQVTIP